MTKKLGDSDSIEPERKGKMLVSLLEKVWEFTTTARDKKFLQRSIKRGDSGKIQYSTSSDKR